jgi:predicted metal-dependent hydrolase
MSAPEDPPIVPEEPPLGDEERRGLEKGLAQFDAGHFFECHDTLEEVWQGLRGPARDFFQGLIQAAVGFYHLGNGNRGGSETMLRRAFVRLERYGDSYYGVDLARLRLEVSVWAEKVRSGDLEGITLDDLPKLRHPLAPGHSGAVDPTGR